MQDTRVEKPFSNSLIGDMPTNTLRNDPCANKTSFIPFPLYLSLFFFLTVLIIILPITFNHLIQRNLRTIEERVWLKVSIKNTLYNEGFVTFLS